MYLLSLTCTCAFFVCNVERNVWMRVCVCEEAWELFGKSIDSIEMHLNYHIEMQYFEHFCKRKWKHFVVFVGCVNECMCVGVREMFNDGNICRYQRQQIDKLRSYFNREFHVFQFFFSLLLWWKWNFLMRSLRFLFCGDFFYHI